MKNNYNIADDEWEWYIGQLYYRLIKEFFISGLNNVVELAPGFRYKIAYALKEFNFSGNIYIVDSSQDVLDYVNKKYKEIIPKANIICINKKFEDCLNLLPNDIDLFLSNHSIDDLIISNYSDCEYNKESNNELLLNDLLELWKKLYKNKESKNRIISKVYDSFKLFFNKKNIRYAIIGQYRSNLYYLGKSNYIDEIVEECFNGIKKLTDTDNKRINQILDFYPFGKDDERYNGKYLIDNTQNAKHWIAGKIKK